MNTDKIARNYKSLTPWERVPLIADAIRRADKLELHRLESSAPRHSFRMVHHYGLIDGLDQMATAYMLRQLGAALDFSGIENQLELNCWNNRTIGSGEERLIQVSKLLAFQSVARADAWQLFCADLHLDPDTIIINLPGYEAVRRFEELSRFWACSAKEGAAYRRRLRTATEKTRGKEPAPKIRMRSPTARQLANQMHAELEQLMEAWE